MFLLFRCLKIVFWLSVAATVAWLVLSNSGFVANAFGVRDSQTVFTVPVTTIAACSGLILWRAWREDPAEESEYGEWTNEQLFYAIVFAITLFVAFLALPGWYFVA